MKTAEYLGMANRINRIIQNKLTDLQQFKESSLSVPSTENKERVQTTMEPDKIGRIVAKLDEMEKDIDAKIDEYVKVKETIVSQITDISDERYYGVLFSKYIENKRMEEIAIKMDFSFRYAKALHGEALQEFEKKYGEIYAKLNGINDVLQALR